MRKLRNAFASRPDIFRPAALISLFTAAVIALKLFVPLESAEKKLGRLISSDELMRLAVMLELGAVPKDNEEEQKPLLSISFMPDMRTAGVIDSDSAISSLIFADETAIRAPEVRGEFSYLPIGEIANSSGYTPDTSSADVGAVKLTGSASPQILIIHTHGSEAFTQAGDDVYVESDPYRTEDTEHNIVRVGDELAERLYEHGIAAIHDRGIYDYPSYSGSYSRAYEVICRYLEEYPDIKMVIDVHRDSAKNSDGTEYGSFVTVNGKRSAQVMLICGTDWSGLAHDGWEQNFNLAKCLQSSMEQMYPGLARPIYLNKYRYNQHATPGSLILEVGYGGNTMEEALNAVRCFSDAFAWAVG